METANCKNPECQTLVFRQDIVDGLCWRCKVKAQKELIEKQRLEIARLKAQIEYLSEPALF
jgi:hypothetical protein